MRCLRGQTCHWRGVRPLAAGQRLPFTSRMVRLKFWRLICLIWPLWQALLFSRWFFKWCSPCLACDAIKSEKQMWFWAIWRPSVQAISPRTTYAAWCLQKLPETALEHLSTGGHFVTKLFQGRDTDSFTKNLRQHFEKVVMRNPKQVVKIRWRLMRLPSISKAKTIKYKVRHQTICLWERVSRQASASVSWEREFSPSVRPPSCAHGFCLYGHGLSPFFWWYSPLGTTAASKRPAHIKHTPVHRQALSYLLLTETKPSTTTRGDAFGKLFLGWPRETETFFERKFRKGRNTSPR